MKHFSIKILQNRCIEIPIEAENKEEAQKEFIKLMEYRMGIEIGSVYGYNEIDNQEMKGVFMAWLEFNSCGWTDTVAQLPTVEIPEGQQVWFPSNKREYPYGGIK